MINVMFTTARTATQHKTHVCSSEHVCPPKMGGNGQLTSVPRSAAPEAPCSETEDEDMQDEVSSTYSCRVHAHAGTWKVRNKSWSQVTLSLC